MNLYYQEHQVSEALRPFVLCYWTMQSDGRSDELSPLQRCFPSGTIELIVHLRGNRMKGLKQDEWFDYPRAIITGICDRASAWVSYGQCELLGVRFTPEGMLRLFGPPLKEYHNSFLDADAFLHKKVTSIIDHLIDAESLRERLFLLECFLHSQIKHTAIERNYFTEALRLIRSQDALNITDLSKQVYVCERQLQRAFQNTLGISPKGYHRVMRLYKAHKLGLIRSDNFTDIAYQLGYSDQAHFTRDFKNYFGVAPEVHFNSSNMYWTS